MSGVDETGERWWGRRWLAWAVIVAGALLCVGPTLPLVEWSFGSEAVNVATALEMRRTGHWLVPTIQGEARLNKPPLTAWITAAAISERTMAEIGSLDPAARAAGQRRLQWEARWPSAVLLCLALVAVYELGRAVGGGGAGMLSAVAGGTCLLFLRHARWAQTDTQLAVWVAVTNALLALAVLKGRWWRGCVGGGIALGIGILAKGQMAPLMTVVPVAVFAAVRRPRVNWAAVVVGLVLAIAVGGWWFAYIGATSPHGWGVFFREATRIGANELKPDSPRNYARYLVLMLPWTPVMVWGAVEAFRRRSDARLAVLLVVVPLLVMLPFKERKERYLAPLLAGGAVMAGYGMAVLGSERRVRRHGPWVVGAAAVVMAGYNGWGAAHDAREDRSIMRPFAEAVWQDAPRAELYGYAPVDTQAAYLLVPGAEMAIYLDRPVHWTADTAGIGRRAGADQALMLVMPTSDVLAAARSLGWGIVRDETRRDVRRVVMIRGVSR